MRASGGVGAPGARAGSPCGQTPAAVAFGGHTVSTARAAGAYLLDCCDVRRAGPRPLGRLLLLLLLLLLPLPLPLPLPLLLSLPPLFKKGVESEIRD